ncbi:MAG TPA: alkaline phosphatase family protein [Solirubrobacteraceae bacterium]|nr:alkaline phosphatase family protein [Solirubrobacteraceae bacterium]
MAARRKLVLCVIDAMAPAQLERAVAAGEAPTLAELMRRGLYIPDCVAAFPSVTPVCAAAIATGVWQDEHHIPGMCWYHRGEGRYVEYGSSFRASQRVGLGRQLTDTVYNMNGAHLSRAIRTVFEVLDDADVRTAGTTYLMYRGRHRHEPSRSTTMTRIAASLLRHAVMGPRELFYADIFASRQTGCRSNLGMPGVRDRHSGCVGAYLAEHDLFDFMLLSLPDNDWRSHRSGPDGQLRSLALADIQLARVLGAAGGLDAFLDEHAVIVMADHSQAPVSATIDLRPAFAELGVLAPSTRWHRSAIDGIADRSARARAGLSGGRAGSTAQGRSPLPRLALCPSQRAAMLYVLDVQERERECQPAHLAAQALEVEGVELAMWLARDVHGAPTEAVIARRPDGGNGRGGRGGAGGPHTGELRFRPGDGVRDLRGRAWSLDGSLSVLGGELRDGRLHAPDFPDALARVWSALTCPSSGDVLLSAASGHEFLDLGGQAHVGGGSHGSLRAEDSLGAAIVSGIEGLDGREQWTIADFAALAQRHFA